MSPFAVLLLVISAATHAGWNLLSSGKKPSLWFYATAEGSIAIVSIPLWPWAVTTLRGVDDTFIALLGLSCSLQAVYYAGLAAAYRRDGMAMIYPAVRAIPVAGMALLAGSLGWRPLGIIAGLGISLVVVGCIFGPLAAAWRGKRLDAATRPMLVAAGAGLGYALLDAHLATVAVQQVGSLGIVALAIGMCIGNAVACGLLGTLLCRGESPANALRGRRWEAAACGVGAWLSYGTYLAALPLVANPSYAAALRQFSIPLGVILALTVRGERPGRLRMLGTCVVILGGVVVALAPR